MGYGIHWRGFGRSGHVAYVLADTAADLPTTDPDVGAGSQGYDLATGDHYDFDGATWSASGGGGGGAPTTADYLVKTANAGLSAERVVTDTSSIAWDWGTAGQAKASVVDDSVSDAKLRNSAGVSVIGRAANSTGDPADIAASADDQLLRRVSGSLSFGTATTAMLAANIVTYAKLQQAGACTVLGRSANSTGDVAEIAAASNGLYLQRASNALAFAAIAAADLPNHASRHQHGGADEVATATPAANAIPKAGAGGKIDNGWLRPYSPILEYKPGSADTPDDDFAASTPDAKWTVVLGAPGSVNLLETGTTVSRYDLTTRPGWLLMQAGLNNGQAVQWRQTYTLPDGNSLIAAVTFGLTQNSNASAGTSVNNSCQIGLQLSSTDTISSGTYFEIDNDAQGTATPRVIVQGSTGGITDVGPDNKVDGRMVFLRVARSSLTYYFFFSHDGVTWQPVANRTAGSALSRFHIYVQANGSGTTCVPIVAWKFVRLGSNNLDPW